VISAVFNEIPPMRTSITKFMISYKSGSVP
jgi:hypothetical protein